MAKTAGSVWETAAGEASRGLGRCEIGRGSAGATSSVDFQCWPLETTEHGTVVALHPLLLAMVHSHRRQDTIVIVPLPPQASQTCRPHVALQPLRFSAPAGPVRALRLEDGSISANSPLRVLLIAATPSDVFLWDVASLPAEPVQLFGVRAPVLGVPALAFDESGNLAVVGGIGADCSTRLVLFHTSNGKAVASADVPVDDVAITACCFLRAAFAFVLVAAVHATDSDEGLVLVYDMRGCGEGGACPRRTTATHETEPMQGAPFPTMIPHCTQASVFLLGGMGRVSVLQVSEPTPGGRLSCTRLADVALAAIGTPLWLKDHGGGDTADDGDQETCVGADVGNDACHGAVLSLAAMECRVLGSPESLGLLGTAAITVTAGAFHVVWSHKRTAERLGTLPAAGAAAACTLPGSSGTVLAVILNAFTGGGELARFSLAPELELQVSRPDRIATLKATSTDPLLESLLELGLQGDDELLEDPPMCSVLPLGPIPRESVLGRALAAPRPGSAGGAGSSKPQARSGSAPHRNRGTVANQPVTFHRKVKSAGYGPTSEPPRVLGRPRLSAKPASRPDFGPPVPSRGSRAPPRPASVGDRGGARSSNQCTREGPPLEPCPEQAFQAYTGGAIVDLCFTPQASHLLVGGSDRTVLSYRLPLAARAASRGERGGGPAPRALGMAGHQSDLLGICPSYTDSHSTGGGGGPVMLTSAEDRTARLWALSGTYAGSELLCFDRLRTNTKPSHKEDNPVLEQVQDAQFMCLDGAIAIALGSRLGIYKYELHTQNMDDDIKRLQRLGSYRCCGLLSLPREPMAGSSIVAIAVNNTLMSGTAIVVSSTKRIYAWDIAAERVLATAPDASIHSRPVTCLRLAHPVAEFQSTQSLDLFYTAAMDGTAKLWDLRCMQECRCFEGAHTHSAQRLRGRLSGCLRYLCMPSEDGLVCAYDVGTGRVLGSRHCHRDAVCSVDLHPRLPGMASGGFDGKVSFYRVPAVEGARPSGGAGGGGGLIERPGTFKEVEMQLPL